MNLQLPAPAESAIHHLVDVRRFSALTQLVKAIAWIWRAAKKFIGQGQTMKGPKWEAVFGGVVISVRETKDALRHIQPLVDKKKKKFQATVLHKDVRLF